MLLQGGPTERITLQNVNKPMSIIRSGSILYLADALIDPSRLLFQLMDQVPSP